MLKVIVVRYRSLSKIRHRRPLFLWGNIVLVLIANMLGSFILPIPEAPSLVSSTSASTARTVDIRTKELRSHFRMLLLIVASEVSKTAEAGEIAILACTEKPVVYGDDTHCITCRYVDGVVCSAIALSYR